MSLTPGVHTVTNRAVCLASYPKEVPAEENFEVKEFETSFTTRDGSNDVFLENLYISVDPYLRLRMLESADGLFFDTFEIGKPISTMTLSRVLASDNQNFKEGDLVTAMADVANFTVVSGGLGLQKVYTEPGVPESYHLGILGLPGFTAWVGLFLIGQAKKGDGVYISAAAGAVGIVAGQLAKLRGCRVVGSEGSDEKVKLLKEEFRFDDAFNYKVENDWDSALSKSLPNGIDVYFENVGGHMLEAVLRHVNRNGRIAVCGMISGYNKDWQERDGVRNLMNIVGKCVKMEGFLTMNHIASWPDFTQEVNTYIREGKIKYTEYAYKGLESFPAALAGLFKGETIGKVLIQL